MKVHFKIRIQFLLAILSCILFNVCTFAQSTSKIDWSKDTISKADAKGASLTYLNKIKGSGQPNATEKVNIPIDKLKEVVDACAKYGISEVAFIFISIRQQDVARFKRNNPNSTASDEQINGSQMLVIKVPKAVFSKQAGAKNNIQGASNLSISMLSSGFVLQKQEYTDLPFAADSYYFSFGSICPPPASCDTFEDL